MLLLNSYSEEARKISDDEHTNGDRQKNGMELCCAMESTNDKLSFVCLFHVFNFEETDF